MTSKSSRFLFKYLAIGWGFALIVESINMGILQGNWIGMLQTIAIVYSAFILINYFLYQNLVFKKWHPAVQFLLSGLIGLVGIEWLLIGTFPQNSGSLVT